MSSVLVEIARRTCNSAVLPPHSAATRALLIITMLVGMAGLASAQTVTILQPLGSSTVASPVRVQATVQDTSTVTLTQIYIDGIKKYEIAASGVNTTISLATGQHRFTVQAMDSAGRIFKSTVYATVGTTTTSPPPSTSPTGSTVYSNIQQMTGWLTCGACGNSGGTGTLANYLMTRGITSPSLSGSSAEFSIGGSTPTRMPTGTFATPPPPTRLPIWHTISTPMFRRDTRMPPRPSSSSASSGPVDGSTISLGRRSTPPIAGASLIMC